MYDHLLKYPRVLMSYVVKQLNERNREARPYPRGMSGNRSTSAVLFLLGRKRFTKGGSQEPSVVLNKRSQRVRQPGDLCFPGGSVAQPLDRFLAFFLGYSPMHLRGWPHWFVWRKRRPEQARRLALLLATSLRESFEEMRLNPFGVRFLGPLPPTNLVMFQRQIYPLVGWIQRQQRFFPNWEVERILYVPLRELLKKKHYACYRIRFGGREGGHRGEIVQDFPCFVHQQDREILWGATYRMVVNFLDTVFEFRPPPLETLPVVAGFKGEHYHGGARA